MTAGKPARSRPARHPRLATWSSFRPESLRSFLACSSMLPVQPQVPPPTVRNARRKPGTGNDGPTRPGTGGTTDAGTDFSAWGPAREPLTRPRSAPGPTVADLVAVPGGADEICVAQREQMA